MTSPGYVSKTPLKSIGARDIIKLDFQKKGHLRKEGRLERSLLGQIVGITWRQVFVVLRDGCCYIFDNDQSTQPKTAFSFENYCRLECVEKPPDLDYCFKLLPRVNYVEMKEHIFAACDDNSRKEWLVAFYKAFHVANDLPEPSDVGKDDWTKDIFKRNGGNRYDYLEDEHEGNLSITKRRYSDMPISAKSKSQVFKTRSLPPIPKEDLSYDEPELDSESELPDESYDDCLVGSKPQPSKIKPKSASLPPLPQAPIQPSPTADRESYINMDLKNPKIDDLPLFEGSSADAKTAIGSEAVGTFIIRKSSQSESRIPYAWFNSKEVKESEEFYVIKDTDFLPRYTYHRSLLNWCTEGLPLDPIFQECHFEECTIITGGCINNEIISKIFGETAMHGKVSARNLYRGTGDTMHADVLIVYFFRNNIAKAQQDIVKLKRQLPFENGLILFVMTTKSIDDERLKSRIIEIFSQLQISQVEFVFENRSEIIKKMTFTLEQRISLYLEQTKMKLSEYSLSHNVGTSLMDVKATLRRLKQAECYPKPFTEDEEEKNEYIEVDELLKGLGDKILFNGYDGDILYVITADQEVKEFLEDWFRHSRFKSIHSVVTVEDTLQICELGKTGVPLHGAKFVFVDEEAEAFHTNQSFATTGSLMEANNDISKFTVAVTCLHSVEKSETLYTLIDGSVVKLGQVLPQPNNKMERLHDDIAAVLIDDDTGAICEKLLIDDSEFPSPARISMRDLKKGDIVHKRGAKTGLTTGTVKDIKFEPIGHFPLPSRVIFISGRESKQFADKGDSGSIVFQHSLSPEENVLDVFAMVQGKLTSPNPNAVIVCFPFKDGCENLTKNIPDLQELRFFDV